jgi:hypothetical protein
MSDLRELTNAELDIVCGGLTSVVACRGMTTFGGEALRRNPCGENLVKEIIADILRILEPNNCGCRQKALSA